MSSRNMSLLPRATLHSDSEQSKWAEGGEGPFILHFLPLVVNILKREVINRVLYIVFPPNMGQERRQHILFYLHHDLAECMYILVMGPAAARLYFCISLLLADMP